MLYSPVEVHISDVSQREPYRQISYVSEYCEHRIMGHGFKGYTEAIDYLVKKYPELMEEEKEKEEKEEKEEEKQEKQE